MTSPDRRILPLVLMLAVGCSTPPRTADLSPRLPDRPPATHFRIVSKTPAHTVEPEAEPTIASTAPAPAGPVPPVDTDTPLQRDAQREEPIRQVAAAAETDGPTISTAEARPRPVLDAPSGPPVPQPAGETLEAAWSIALATNQKLQSRRNATGAAVYAHEAAKGARLPRVTTVNGYTFLDKTPGVAVSLPGLTAVPFGALPIGEDRFLASATLAAVPLYTGGRITSGIYSTGAAVNSRRFDEATEVQNLKMQVAEAFIAVLRAGRLEEVARASVETYQAHLKDVQDLFDEGVVARNDVLAAEVAAAQAREQLIRARNGLDLARSNYNRLLGRPLDAPVVLAEIPIGGEEHMTAGDLHAMTAIATQTRSELQALAYQTWKLQHQSDQERARCKPQLGAVGGFQYLENDNLNHEGFWSLSFVAEWEMFDGGISRNKAAALEQQASSLTRLHADTTSAIALQVRNAWLEIQTAQERIAVAETSVKSAEENLRVAQDRYRRQVGTNTDVLDAVTLLTESRTSLQTATYDLQLAHLLLRRAMGTL
ncbi:TolC family protein [Maioricimonas sp. JC845]|uniref:TolC family protein n=1 Tax=Maioricimonas sp. JC845 TaxID=3232138 RepID=UPI0034581681